MPIRGANLYNYSFSLRINENKNRVHRKKLNPPKHVLSIFFWWKKNRNWTNFFFGISPPAFVGNARESWAWTGLRRDQRRLEFHRIDFLSWTASWPCSPPSSSHRPKPSIRPTAPAHVPKSNPALFSFVPQLQVTHTHLTKKDNVIKQPLRRRRRAARFGCQEQQCCQQREC